MYDVVSVHNTYTHTHIHKYIGHVRVVYKPAQTHAANKASSACI